MSGKTISRTPSVNLLDYIEKLTNVQTLQELRAIAEEYAAQTGFDAILYGRKGRSVLDTGQPLVVSNFNMDWMGEYLQRNAFQTDPLVIHSLSRVTAATWEDATKLHADKKGLQMMRDAADHKLNSGIVVPVQGALGEHAMISLCSDHAPKEIAAYFTSYQAEMTLFALHYHESMTRILGSAMPEVVLTRREKEVLSAAADGKDTSCMAQLMGISEATVLAHFTNVFRKLGAQNRVHAVAIALQNGIIYL